MDNLRTVCHPGITPEQARDARVRAWAYIFNRYRDHKAVHGDGDEDDPKEKIDDRT
jgi:hypothetical protein